MNFGQSPNDCRGLPKRPCMKTIARSAFLARAGSLSRIGSSAKALASVITTSTKDNRILLGISIAPNSQTVFSRRRGPSVWGPPLLGIQDFRAPDIAPLSSRLPLTEDRQIPLGDSGED